MNLKERYILVEPLPKRVEKYSPTYRPSLRPLHECQKSTDKFHFEVLPEKSNVIAEPQEKTRKSLWDKWFCCLCSEDGDDVELSDLLREKQEEEHSTITFIDEGISPRKNDNNSTTNEESISPRKNDSSMTEDSSTLTIMTPRKQDEEEKILEHKESKEEIAEEEEPIVSSTNKFFFNSSSSSSSSFSSFSSSASSSFSSTSLLTPSTNSSSLSLSNLSRNKEYSPLGPDIHASYIKSITLPPRTLQVPPNKRKVDSKNKKPHTTTDSNYLLLQQKKLEEMKLKEKEFEKRRNNTPYTPLPVRRIEVVTTEMIQQTQTNKSSNYHPNGESNYKFEFDSDHSSLESSPLSEDEIEGGEGREGEEKELGGREEFLEMKISQNADEAHNKAVLQLLTSLDNNRKKECGEKDKKDSTTSTSNERKRRHTTILPAIFFAWNIIKGNNERKTKSQVQIIPGKPASSSTSSSSVSSFVPSSSRVKLQAKMTTTMTTTTTSITTTTTTSELPSSSSADDTSFLLESQRKAKLSSTPHSSSRASTERKSRGQGTPPPASVGSSKRQSKRPSTLRTNLEQIWNRSQQEWELVKQPA